MAQYNYNMEIINNVVVLFRELSGFDGNVYIPEGVIAIGNRAFEVCYCGVKYVDIPSSVKRIGDGAFSCCEKLQEIVIPRGVEVIGKDAFYNCHNLTYKNLLFFIFSHNFVYFSCNTLKCVLC